MTRIKVKKLIWDDYNREHISKHKVSVEEVDEAGRNFLAHEKTKKGRYLIIGRVGARMLTVIINRKGTGIYYPVTARDSAKKERIKVYEKERNKKEKN